MFSDFFVHLFKFKLDYYVYGAAGFFALLFIIGIFAALSGKINKIKRAQRAFIANPTQEGLENAVNKMPKEIRAGYATANAKGKDGALSFKFDTCVKAPYAFSFASKFVKYTFIITVIMSLLVFAVFNFAPAVLNARGTYADPAAFAAEAVKWSYNMYLVMAFVALAGLLFLLIAAVIASSRYKGLVKSYNKFSASLLEMKADPAAAAEEAENALSAVDALVAKINKLAGEGASVTTLKETAFELHQERTKPANCNPAVQKKLNDSLNVLIKAMSAAVKK